MKKILVIIVCMLAMPCVVYADAVMPDSAGVPLPVFETEKDREEVRKLQKELVLTKKAYIEERQGRLKAEFTISEIDYKNLQKEFEELVAIEKKKEAKNDKK